MCSKDMDAPAWKTLTQIANGDWQTDGLSNISGLGATSMLNFHRGLGAIFWGLGASNVF